MFARLVLAAAATAAAASAAGAATFNPRATAYSLGDEGTSLVTIATALGASGPSVPLSFMGGDATSIDALAYRPKTRQLYGYDDAGDTVYLIDPETGSADAVASEMDLTTTPDLGFDFNNVLDAARIVTAEDENRVFFPNNMPPDFARVTDLFYPGDPDRDPTVTANAYTNAVPMPEETLQYVLDAATDTLGTLANNEGILADVGPVTLDGSAFDFTADGIGFDILSFAEGDNTAYALLTGAESGDQGLYEISLFDGSLTLVDGLDGYGALDGLAVAPIPVPAALPLLGGAIAGLGLMRRRRRP